MRNKIILLMLLSIITAFSYQESYEVLAHFEEIDVSYDECVPVDYVDENNIGDGIHERWYTIFPDEYYERAETCHISYTSGYTPEIKYFIYNNSINKNYNGQNYYYWNSVISTTDSNQLKSAFVNSMMKWDNVYVYIYEDNNNVTRRKLVNISEGTESNHNLSIYPENGGSYAITDQEAKFKQYIYTNNNVPHYHCSKRLIKVFPEGIMGVSIEEKKDILLERTGAHELGHILGLGDIDISENSSSNSPLYHHEELLMGAAKFANLENRQTNITYKDIAGAMITMGFHTNNDHKWMYIENQDIIDEETGNIIANDGYKLICSICNGYKYSTTLPNGSVKFEQCKNPNTNISDHSLSSGNMMAVASYDNYDEDGNEYDYYKCKYCRYVAPFSANEKQIYGSRTYIPNNTNQHYLPSLSELDYNLLENHYSDYQTNTLVPYPTNHPQFALKHIVSCGCNEIQTSRPHSFTASDINDGGAYNTCIDCEAMIRVNSGGPGIVGPLSNDIWQVTDNGSYKLSNGIIVLVDEDIQAYKKGTLVFKYANSEII